MSETIPAGEQTTSATHLDHAKAKDYLEHFTAEREEAWIELNRAQQRFDALTKTVVGFQQILASLSSDEAETSAPPQDPATGEQS